MGPSVTAMDVQTERSYQKQPHIFAGKARLLSRSTRKGPRQVKSIGLGFKVPAKAKEGRYIDKKCPFVGQVSIRGKLLRGVVHRTFMKNTITFVGITFTTRRSTVVTRSVTR